MLFMEMPRNQDTFIIFEKAVCSLFHKGERKIFFILQIASFESIAYFFRHRLSAGICKKIKQKCCKGIPQQDA